MISSGRRAAAVLQFGIKEANLYIWVHLVRTAIKCMIIAAFCIHKVCPPLFYNSSLPILSLSFFSSKAADERNRWFVLWLVSAPLSPLSDHLHLLPSNAAPLWSCAHNGQQHMPETGSVRKYATCEVPIKKNLKVMKQLRAVVKVARRPFWPK